MVAPLPLATSLPYRFLLYLSVVFLQAENSPLASSWQLCHPFGSRAQIKSLQSFKSLKFISSEEPKGEKLLLISPLWWLSCLKPFLHHSGVWASSFNQGRGLGKKTVWKVESKRGRNTDSLDNIALKVFCYLLNPSPNKASALPQGSSLHCISLLWIPDGGSYKRKKSVCYVQSNTTSVGVPWALPHKNTLDWESVIRRQKNTTRPAAPRNRVHKSSHQPLRTCFSTYTNEGREK